MKNSLTGFVLALVIFSGALFGIHYYIFSTLFNDIQLYFPLWSIYAFNAFLVLLVYLIINYQNRVNKKSNFFNLFVMTTVAKMVVVLIFLLPVFFGKATNPQAEVINFFIVYFLFLTFEIFYLNKIFSK